MQLLSLLPWQDALALAWFIAVWVGYAWYSRNASLRGATLLAVTNAWRRKWMLQVTQRDPRIVDGNIIQSLSSSPSFFASSTLIVIGGVLALFGATDKAADVIREAGITWPEVLRMDLTDYDMRALRKIKAERGNPFLDGRTKAARRALNKDSTDA